MRILIVFTALIISGCVSENTILTNADGRSVDCHSWGFGLIGAPIAMASHANCVDKAHAAGYSEYPDGRLVPAKGQPADPAASVVAK